MMKILKYLYLTKDQNNTFKKSIKYEIYKKWKEAIKIKGMIINHVESNR